jgi:ABC-type sugar transport system permease subunit
MIEHEVSSAMGHPPGRHWYAVAALIALATWIAVPMFLVSRLGDAADRMTRVLAPGQADLMLKEPGTYTIFHEYRSTFEGRVYDVATVSGLAITVRSQPDGQDIPLNRASGSRYSIVGRAGRSLFNFEARTPGTYRISAAYDGGRKEPQTVLAIDREFIGDLTWTIVWTVMMGLVGMGTAITMAVLVFIKRRRAQQAAAS